MHSDVLSTGLHGPLGLETFPKLYAELRIVNPGLLSASAADGASPEAPRGQRRMLAPGQVHLDFSGRLLGLSKVMLPASREQRRNRR